MAEEENTQKGMEVRVKPPSELPQVTPESINQTTQSIALLQGMVKNILTREIDYGRIPGTPQDSLWDPGASLIIGAFNCYIGDRHILKLEDNDNKIAVCLEVPLISRSTQRVVGSGVGAASTLETKYKYRWVPDPIEWGYDTETIKSLKRKKGNEGKTLYRISNPEHSELLNTIVKMASKRAEVDAAQGLPGVSSVLRQLFSGKKPKAEKEKEEEYETPAWQRFWGEVTRLGLTREEAYTKLGVTTMKDWLSKGSSLEQAIDILRGKTDEKPPEIEPTVNTEIPSSEPPAIGDSRLQGWKIAQDKVKKLGITDTQLAKWWHNYGITMTLKEMNEQLPPDTVTNQMLSTFVDMMALYEEQTGKR